MDVVVYINQKRTTETVLQMGSLPVGRSVEMIVHCKSLSVMRESA